ncbi:hypothetical protein NOGI109294_25985 [Nocardiopsis gilva]
MGRPPPRHQRHPVPNPHRDILWHDLPERYSPWETAAGRHRRWCLDGTWQRIDSTSVRAHSHAAGAAKKGTRRGTNRMDRKHSDAPRAG